MKKQVRITDLILCVIIILFSSCGDDSDGCPFCSDDLATEVVLPNGTESLIIEMKWSALQEASSIVDPSLVCEDNFQDVLLRRHIRASACVWTPQCKIILGTVVGPTSNYGLFADADVSLGQPGDVVVGNGIPYSQEMDDLAIQADNHWQNKPTGINAISIREFIWPDGEVSAIKGIGFSNSGVRPTLFMVDPEFLGNDQNNHEDRSIERTLAHELGHTLELCHIDESNCNQVPNDSFTNNLMISSGSENNKLLTVNQCNLARTNYPSVFSANPQGERLIGSITDERDRTETFAKDGATDLFKILFREKTASKNLNILLGTNGLLKNVDNVTYSIAIDVDNDANTGMNANNLVSQSTQRGVELLIEISVNKGELEVNFIRDGAVVMSSSEDPKNQIAISSKTININAFSDKGCVSTPVFDEIELEVSGALLELLGLAVENETLFSKNPKIQAFSSYKTAEKSTVVDQCPRVPRSLKTIDLASTIK